MVSTADSRPERRNLLFISIGFIAFFLGGGHIPTDDLTLQMVTISFNRPIVLTIIIWVIFVWFLFRFWILTHQEFDDVVRTDLKDLRDLKFIREYVEKRIEDKLITLRSEPYMEKEGLVITDLYVFNNTIHIDVKELKLRFNNQGNISSQGLVKDGFNETVKLEGIKGSFMKFKLYLKWARFKPSFTTYFIPYFLASYAIFLAIAERLGCI